MQEYLLNWIFKVFYKRKNRFIKVTKLSKIFANTYNLVTFIVWNYYFIKVVLNESIEFIFNLT